MRTFGIIALAVFGGILTVVGLFSIFSRNLGQFLPAAAILVAGIGALGLATRLNRTS